MPDNFDYADPDPDNPGYQTDETPVSTQGFWSDQLLNAPMPYARNEQAYQKELDDYYSGIEEREGIDERPDDWAVKGTKRGSLDKMQKGMPPYYPVPGDVLKDKEPGQLEKRPWMKPAQSEEISDKRYYPPQSNTMDQMMRKTRFPFHPYDEPVSPELPQESLRDWQMRDAREHPQDYPNTQRFWERQLLEGKMPSSEPLMQLGDPKDSPEPDYHPKWRDLNSKKPTVDYAELTWDSFPLV